MRRPESVDFVSKPYAKTSVTIYPELISKRTFNHVMDILDGVRVSPATGDACLISSVLTDLYDLPVARVQKQSKGLSIQYLDVTEELIDQINPFFTAERVAIRLDNTDVRHSYLRYEWSTYHNNRLSRLSFNDMFVHVDCYDEIAAAFREYRKPYAEAFKQAKFHLTSKTPITYQFRR